MNGRMSHRGMRVRQMILAVLADEHPAALDTGQIAGRVGVTTNYARVALVWLELEGDVVRRWQRSKFGPGRPLIWYLDADATILLARSSVP